MGCVRRYQNPDGTLTAAGRERYGNVSTRKKQKFLNKYADENGNLTEEGRKRAIGPTGKPSLALVKDMKDLIGVPKEAKGDYKKVKDAALAVAKEDAEAKELAIVATHKFLKQQAKTNPEIKSTEAYKKVQQEWGERRVQRLLYGKTGQMYISTMQSGGFTKKEAEAPLKIANIVKGSLGLTAVVALELLRR